jgi:hypothetical protein
VPPWSIATVDRRHLGIYLPPSDFVQVLAHRFEELAHARQSFLAGHVCNPLLKAVFLPLHGSGLAKGSIEDRVGRHNGNTLVLAVHEGDQRSTHVLGSAH